MSAFVSRLAPAAAAALVLAAGAGATPEPLAQVSVSRAPGLQAEVAIAVDPGNAESLLAGSNSLGAARDGFARWYASADGGATWTSAPGPAPARRAGGRRCSIGDPAVAFGRGGRQYYAFLSAPCRADLGEADLTVTLEVAARPGSGSPWRSVGVFPVRTPRIDDKPAIAVDVSPESPHADRVYVAWSRTAAVRVGRHVVRQTRVVLSASDDGGATWSAPVPVDDAGGTSPPIFVTLALDRAGTLYAGWTDLVRRILVDRSTDGGATFGRDVVVDTAVGLPADECDTAGMSIPAQGRRCITPTPQVGVDDRPDAEERVYVTYGAPGADGTQHDVFVAGFDGSLASVLGRPGSPRVRVNREDGPVAADQFMPASAVDRSTGLLWVCFYDTTGDRRRQRVRYSCTASADGGATWPPPVRVASATSNASVRRASPFQFGDFEGVAAAAGVAHPIWTDTRDLATLREEIYTTALTQAELQLP